MSDASNTWRDPDLDALSDPRLKLIQKLTVETYGPARALEMACLPPNFREARFEMRRRSAARFEADRYAARRQAANQSSRINGAGWMANG
jgi:hypothetical protein